MLRSTLFAVIFVSLAGCNVTETVGANDAGGGGASSSTGAPAGSGGSPSSTTGSGGATSTSNSTSASTSHGSSSSTGSGGGHVEGAYVSLQVQTGFDFLGSETEIEIKASATPIVDAFAPGAPSACAAMQAPNVAAPPPDNIDLSAAHVTVTADGQAPGDAIWSPDFEEFVFQWPASLPPGTTVHVAFDAASPVLPNHGFDLVTPNATLSAPTPSSIYEYASGTDVSLAWSGDPIPYGVASFVVEPSAPPANSTLVVHCAGTGAPSGLSIDAGLMSQLVTDLDTKLQTDMGSQIYVGLWLEKVAADQEPVDGNFVSRSGVVNSSWPVVASN